MMYLIFIGVLSALIVMSVTNVYKAMQRGEGLITAILQTPLALLSPLANIGIKLSKFIISLFRWLPFSFSRIDVIYGAKDDDIVSSSGGYFGNDDVFKNSKAAIINGDLMAAAELRWPKDKFPEYWLDAPEDMRRHVIVDGRLSDGSDPSSELSQMFVTDELIKDSVQKALILSRENAMKTLGILTLVSIALPVILFGWLSNDAIVDVQQAESLTNSDYLVAAAGTSWLASTFSNVMPYVTAFLESGLKLTVVGTFALASLISLLICAVGVSHARFWRDFWNMHRNFIKAVADNLSADLRKMPKEAITRFHYRHEDRREENNAYVKSVNAVNTWDKRDGIILGTATGKFIFRGHLSSPQPGQYLMITDQARAQHILVFGASGLGKTSKILKPLFKKDVQSIIDGHMGSIFVSDGKGDLYRDLSPIAKQAGLKTVVIGTQPNSVGLDLLQGTNPQLVADILASVLKQSFGASGGGSDPFWGAMRDHFIRCVATILEAYERTEAGLNWALENSRRPYSLLNIYRLTQQSVEPGAEIWKMIDAIEAEYADAATFHKFQDIATEGLWGSIEYVYGKWLNMSLNSPATLDGVQANITASLSQFETQEGILQNFASGASSDFSISEMFDQPMAVFTDLNSVDSGLCGRIVLIFIKTLVYLELRKRQMRDSELPKKHSLKIYFDEMQELITSDLVGVSDINFINIARSAMGPGGGFVVATQTMNALEMVVGKVPSANYVDNFSTIISMRHSEPSTIALLKQKAGQTMRYHVTGSNQVESYEAVRQITGRDVLLQEKKVLTDISVIRDKAAYYGALKPSLVFGGFDSPVQADHRFLPPLTTGYGAQMQDNSTAYLNALSAAETRAEDKNKDYFSGAVLQDVLTDADFSQLGDSKAVAVWVRGGHVRMDIIDLPEPIFN